MRLRVGEGGSRGGRKGSGVGDEVKSEGRGSRGVGEGNGERGFGVG